MANRKATLERARQLKKLAEELREQSALNGAKALVTMLRNTRLRRELARRRSKS